MPRGLKRASRDALVKGNLVTVKKIPVVGKVVNVAAAGSGVGFGSVVLDGLPVGNLLYLGGTAYLDFETADTDVVATYDGDFGIGTTPASDATITAGDIDLIGSTALQQAVARVSSGNFGTSEDAAAVALTSTPRLFDNTDGSLEVNLNVLIDADDISDGEDADLTVNGVVYLALAVLGDD